MIFTCLLIIIFYMIILKLSPKRYNSYLPSVIVYPNNENEVSLVENQIRERTHFDIQFFKKTDPSVSYAFHELLPQYSVGELNSMFSKYNTIIVMLKYGINRARPKQITPKLNVLESTTAHTPAYPAGHAFQAYVLEKILSRKHPEKRQELEQLAEKCNIIRIKAGLHYPSDGLFSKKIVNTLL